MKMKMSTLAAVAGVGVVTWMMMKKKNPDVVEDMKCMMKNEATKMLTKLENME